LFLLAALADTLEEYAFGLNFRLLGHHDAQHALFEISLNIFEVDPFGKSEGTREAAVATLKGVILFALLFLFFLPRPGDCQTVTAELNVDVLLLDPRKIGLE